MTTGEETVDIMPEFDFVLEDETTVINEDVETSPEKVTTEEESVEEKEPVVTEETTEETLPEGADPNAYGIYQTMLDKKYVSPNEDFKGTWEEVDAIFETLPDQIFQGVIESLNPKVKAVLEFGYSKEDITDEELTNFFQSIHVPEVDITTEEGQILFLTDELKVEGKEEEAADLIELWKEKGLLETRASKYKEVKEAKVAKLQETQIEQARQEKATKKAQATEFKQKITKEVEATEWKDTRKEVVLNEIFSGNMKTKSQEISKHPKAFYQLADFMTYFDAKTGAFDLENYINQGLTPSTKEVKSKIEKYFQTTSKAVAPNTKTQGGDVKEEVYEFTDI